MKKFRNFTHLLALIILVANQSFAQTIVCSDIQIKVGDSVMDPAIVDEFGCDFTPTSAKEDCSLVSFPVFFDYEGTAFPEPTSFSATTLTVQGTVIGGANVVIDPVNTGRCESQNLSASANAADNTFQVISAIGATISFATAQNPSFWVFVEAHPGETIEIDITSVVRTIEINNQTNTCTLSESTPANPIPNQQILDDLITIKEEASSCQLTDMSLTFSVVEDPMTHDQTVTVSFNHDNLGTLSLDKFDGMIKITDMDGNLEVDMPTYIGNMVSPFNNDNLFLLKETNSNTTTIYFSSDNPPVVNSTESLFEFVIKSPANQDEDGEALVEVEWSRWKSNQAGFAECCQPTLPIPETVAFEGVPDCAGTPDVSFSVTPSTLTQSNFGCTGSVAMVISADKLTGESFSQFEIEVDFTTTGNIEIDEAATLLAFNNNSNIGCPTNNTSGYPNCLEVDEGRVTYVFWTFPEYVFPTDELGLAVVFTGDGTGCVTGADFRMARINSSTGMPSMPSFNCVPTYSNWSGSHCIELTEIVSGRTQYENGAGVPDVTIQVSDSDCATTLTTACNSGSYLFQCQDTEVTITPERTGDFLCGVTTFDLVIVRRHILQTVLLSSPYKLIAADVNNSGSVTTLDLIKMRQLILQINPDFGVNGDISWKFVPEDYTFPNPTNPFNDAYPSSVTANLDCGQEEMVDFVAIKIGDINQSSCDLCGMNNNELGEPIVLTINKDVVASGKAEFRFEVEGFTDIVAYQMDLEYNKNVLTFDKTLAQDLAAVHEDYFGINTIGEGKIRTLWYAEDGLPHSLDNFDRIFNILFDGTGDLNNAVVALYTNDGARLRQPIFNNIAYDAQGRMHPIIQRFEPVKQKLMSHSAFPNPFSTMVQLKLEANAGDFAQISVFDSSGKAVYTDKKYLYAKENIISIPSSTEWSKGIYLYEVQTNQEKYTGKIMKQ